MAELETVPCPLCANTGSFHALRIPSRDDSIRQYGAIFAGRSRSEWKVCGRCGFVHQNPRPTIAALNRYYLEGRYHPPLPYTAEQILADQVPAYEDELDFAIQHSGLASGRVFDVGCGLGVALKLFRDRGWAPYGVEPDSQRCAFARRAWGLENVTQGIVDASTRVEQPVDLVYSHHAFEHLADLDDVMKGITSVLRPGGYLFTAVPTYYRNRTHMSKMWMNSAHYSLFTHRSLEHLLARHGFEAVAHDYDGWRSSPDQLGHLARFTGNRPDPTRFYEDPAEVLRYLRIENPARSLLYYPLHGETPQRIGRAARVGARAFGLLLSSPREFVRKVKEALRP